MASGVSADGPEKECRRCRNSFQLNFFVKDATRNDGLHPYCKACRNYLQNENRKKKMKTDPDYVDSVRKRDRARWPTRKRKKRTKDEHKDYFLKWKYGIGLDAYNALLAKQDGVCKICGNPETRKNKHTGTCRLHVDHCHETGNIRGLLCQKCNFGLGVFKDDIGLLQEAIKYLLTTKTLN